MVLGNGTTSIGQHDLILFSISLPNDLLKTFTTFTCNIIESGQLSNDYKSCLKTVRLSHIIQ